MNHMRRALPLLLLCLLLASCGTHRKVASASGPAQGAAPRDGTRDAAASRMDVAGAVEYDGDPWVTNASSPLEITKGLANSHISLWASHGRYYDVGRGVWKWQRPYLFCTNEDLFTQTIVVPFLIPMLEKAGANVFTPRERDWQACEVIVDNDDRVLLPYYIEANVGQRWVDCGIRGFAYGDGAYQDGANPFAYGTTRMARASAIGGCEITYQPRIPKAGPYAVYVSYPTHPESVTDARYTVYHKGRATEFHVNQRMGGGTWVYLGTFDFDTGCTLANRVVLTNVSAQEGVVTADAVRFGGGMGRIRRGWSTSGLPKCLEGARYWAQWAGAPDSVWSSHGGADDYKDDINARSYMTNWLAGGSCFAPGTKGLGVPLELSLAVHSDAGFERDCSSVVGSLAICTTDAAGGRLGSGLSRDLSKDFANRLLSGIRTDIGNACPGWNVRGVLDRNYSETRCPLVPSAIIETMSHQSFPDMALGQDPNFRFILARSIYKTILRFLADEHGRECVVAPLAPTGLAVELTPDGMARVSWEAQQDRTEPTSAPTSYVLYASTGSSGFDNGTRVSGTSCKVPLSPGVLYSFRVAAANDGGESFPSEVVSACHDPGATRTVLIVNGFYRVSGPAVVDDAWRQGFDMLADPGVPFGGTIGFSGYQECFDKSQVGIEGPGGLGYSGTELQGRMVMGNEFNYVPVHARAVMAAGRYSVASCSRRAVEEGRVNLGRYDCVDLALGLERDDGHSLVRYKTFTPGLQKALQDYSRHGGNIIASGAYLSSDMRDGREASFLSGVLHVMHGGSRRLGADSRISGMGTAFDIFTQLCGDHYAATSVDVVRAVKPAFGILADSGGNPVGVAFDGRSGRSIALGFPFECITEEAKRTAVMAGFLNFIFR